MFESNPKVKISPLASDLLALHSIQVSIKREDLIHPEVSGNKWRKLKYNLIEAKKMGHDSILTFGGAYSNHIAAVAACAKIEELKSIGIIRGEELNANSNPTLKYAAQQGMTLKFISRTDYKTKEQPGFLEPLKQSFGDFYLVPEGGTNTLAIQGATEILDETTQEYDIIAVSAGTGGTAAGIIKAALPSQNVLVFSSLKGEFLKEKITELVGVGFSSKWTFFDQYHFGGYAKWTPELIEFINWFKKEFGIQLDPVYTGKMLFGLFDLIKTNYFLKPAKVLAIHTGGLQGIQGFNEKFSNLLE